MENILDYWPYDYPPRQAQITALEWIAQQDAKYILCEIPVGGGKSNIGITYSHYIGQRHPRYRGDSFILTPQRILQKQYEDSHLNEKQVNLASLYGKSNYQCASKNSSCEVGALVKPRCAACPHDKAKTFAKSAADTVLNYKLALSSFAFTTTFKPRKLMVMDECHTLENHLIDFDAVTISEWRCKKYKIPFEQHTDLDNALEWMKDVYVPKIGDVLQRMEDQCEHLYELPGDQLTKIDIKNIKETRAMQEHVDEVVELSIRTPEYLNEKYVLTSDKTMNQFKRITGSFAFHKHIEPMAERFLFMSSTILDKDGFCQDLGIPSDDAAFLSLQSDFPVENRPIFYMPQMKMNAKWKDPENTRKRKDMLETIEKLLEMHSDDSGIIHTANFQIADWLVNELKVKHQIFHHNPDSELDRNAVIEEFQAFNKPAVLISPSSTEGLDLKEDLGRFAIFAKVPFGFLGDKWIKTRMDMSQQWYMRRALTDIIQGGGRVVRSNTDSGNVYILDESFAYLYTQSYHMIPKWWKDSYAKV